MNDSTPTGDPHATAIEDGACRNEERPDPAIMPIRTARDHTLEILTEAEWKALSPEDEPDGFFRYRKDCYVKLKPVPKPPLRRFL